jgi:RelA/SpoT family (p)ppGpp synthetase
MPGSLIQTPLETTAGLAPARPARRPKRAPTLLPPLPAEVQRLAATVHERFPSADVAIIEHAYRYAEVAHRGQTRASGEPYITHPVAVAQILADLGLDPEAIAAALLHDVVEDTEVDEVAIDATFGPEVARMVAGVTKISAIEAREKAAAEAESLRRMLLATTDDLRVILIKLADRLHNMQTLGALSQARRERMAIETIEIYAPLANRLGIWQLKGQFEDLVLEVLEPEVYQAIRTELAGRREAHDSYLAEVKRLLDVQLREAGIHAQTKSRTKHFYSIYRKMREKSVGAEQVYDVLAVRVLVDEVPQCYLALGVVHAMWPPMSGEFDDYIAKRKDNLYQSLHTTVFGPGNRPLEVQIRTHEMDEVAEHGVAAHWKYKENTRHSAAFEEKITALRRLLQAHNEDTADAQAFVESLKTDVFRDQVYVFTPKGKVIELPAGSTPVDFAYQIHTEVGHRCRGAIVNDKLVALDTPLQTGQTVSINTAKGAVGPSRDWLNPALGYVASSRARSKIKQWFRRQRRSEAIREGRGVVELQLRKLGLTRMRLDDIARLFEYERLDDFLAAVGRHELPSEAISARVLALETGESPVAPAPVRKLRPTGRGVLPVVGPATGVTLQGADGVHTRVARCCSPLPGERVIGYITRGKGVTLHREDCRNIRRLCDREPDRFIRVIWQQSERQAYPVELRITAYDRSGLVRDISEVISKRGVNMTSISATANHGGGTAVVTAMVELASRESLAGLIDKLGTVENVVAVRRPSG